MKNAKATASLIFLGLMASVPAQASLLTSNTMSGASVIDFSDQTSKTDVIGAVQIGGLVGQDVTVSSTSTTNGLYFNYNGWALVNNGTWGNPATYVALNDNTDAMLFAFNSGPVSAVGGFMNYAANNFGPPYNAHLVISALNGSKQVLESYDITSLADISTPNGYNAGAFRGIQRATSDISYFEVSGGLANSVDNLTFTAAVPEPETYAMMLAGLGLLGSMVRRKKQQA